MGGGNLCAVIPRKPGDLAACSVRQREEAVHGNLVLRTDDLAMRAAFFRIEPRWSIIDPGAPARELYVMGVDLRGTVSEAWFAGVRGWIALGDAPRHYQWALERGAVVFVRWPCSSQQLEHALCAAEGVARRDAVIVGPGDVTWNRNTATILRGRSRINLTPLESHIMGRYYASVWHYSRRL